MAGTIEREAGRSDSEAAVDEIARRGDEGRTRLRAAAGLVQLQQQFKRPVERPFTAAVRGKVTILIGGMTWKHDNMFRAVFQGCGYKCETLPVPDVPAFQIGKEFGNNGQCNPTYFTVGCLVQYLQGLEKQGVPRQDIIDNYVFFTAGSCGPCRFGMYEAEYRFALENAGFGGFRVLLFQQDEGIKAASGEAGLKFSVDFGMGMLNALNLGDVINELVYQVRPYEVNKGETDRVIRDSVKTLTDTLRDRKRWHILEAAPAWARPYIEKNKKVEGLGCTLGKIAHNLYGKEYIDALHACRDSINAIEVDRLRVKPVIKITGEFWAQTTEGDGNFNMFAFLEKEGAQVLVEPIATWIAYMMYVAKEGAKARADAEAPYRDPKWYELKKRLANDLKVL